MSHYCTHYTVMEVKRIMLASEGTGPGVGGHAISAHGFNRADVTDRGKANDSAFHPGWEIQANDGHAKSMVHSSDQYLAVCNALNSDKGQTKLLYLDTLADVGTTVPVVFQTAVSVGSLVPTVRSGSGAAASTKSLNKMHIELFKVGGRLHIHTAYAV